MIGAGSTGAAIAHDLASRGIRTAVVERGEPASGTTGRNHALLHSGGRYAVKDPESAAECIRENLILRRVAPGVIEQTGGLFVAIDDEDLAYREKFLEGCRATGVPAEEISPEEALRMEPRLTESVKAAVRVPDAVIDPYRLVLSWLATAQANGADVYPFTPVEAIEVRAGRVAHVMACDLRRQRRLRLEAPVVINAAGPWAGRVAALAGVSVPVQPSAGVMVALAQRLNQRVINRLRPPGDGDIIVPQRLTSIIGTTSWNVESGDRIPVPPDHVRRMIDEGAKLVPAVRSAPILSAFAAARPLVAGNKESDGRELSRGFQVFDHGRGDGADGLLSVVGGKTTTSRLMAQIVGDRVCEKLGVRRECRTKELPLLPFYRFRWQGGS